MSPRTEAIMFVALCVAGLILFTRLRPEKQPPLVCPPCASVSVAASSSAPIPPMTPAASAAASAADALPASPPLSDASADALVRGLVGRWEGQGLTVEIDPPKPAPGHKPPYRLVVRGPGMPSSGFGCEFSLGETRQGPGDTVWYRAWCSRGKRASVGLGVRDGTVSVVVIEAGDVKVHVDGAKRTQP